MTKYIFVDIDGVLNPDYSTGGLEVVEQGYLLRLDPNQGKLLNKLSEDTGAALIWGSSWQEHSNEVGKHIGLPEMPHLELIHMKFSQPVAQVKALAAVKYAKGSKFVYFDDWPDIGYYFADHKNGLHVCVDPRFGLTDSHIEVAESFLRS